MKKILFILIAVVAFATSVSVASSSDSSVQSENYPQCDSYKPTKIKCYIYNEGDGSWDESSRDFYLHTNKNPWQVYCNGVWSEVEKSNRCEYSYMFEAFRTRYYFTYQ
ncbi:MAG: hypothetical protein IJ442_05045 [Bacteroidaceae bacterium]|nr:hypothetical protein [Bacteroidaceae bacterium]